MKHHVPHAVPRVGRSYEHFPGGFELNPKPTKVELEYEENVRAQTPEPYALNPAL